MTRVRVRVAAGERFPRGAVVTVESAEVAARVLPKSPIIGEVDEDATPSGARVITIDDAPASERDSEPTVDDEPEPGPGPTPARSTRRRSRRARTAAEAPE